MLCLLKASTPILGLLYHQYRIEGVIDTVAMRVRDSPAACCRCKSEKALSDTPAISSI